MLCFFNVQYSDFVTDVPQFAGSYVAATFSQSASVSMCPSADHFECLRKHRTPER